jgi:molybdenum cofactor biosynthesis MoaF-like protein
LTSDSTDFPLAGRVCRADYGDAVFEHDYRVPGKLTFNALSGPVQGYEATVEYTVVRVREDVFAISFLDGPFGVVAVEDLGQRTIATFMALPGEPPTAMRGTLTFD